MYKIAVPSREAMVDEHFGHCAYFTVFSVDDAGAVSGSESFTPPPACGCKSNLAATLADMGVTTLIAGNMGEGAVAKVRASGIRVIRGASGPVTDAVTAFLAGNLTDSREICAVHDHLCQTGIAPMK